jgi:hypothetical protein
VAIAYDRISDIGARELVRRLTSLQTLDLCGNYGIRAGLIESLEPVGFERRTPLEINLAKTDIPIEDIFRWTTFDVNTSQKSSLVINHITGTYLCHDFKYILDPKKLAKKWRFFYLKTKLNYSKI